MSSKKDTPSDGGGLTHNPFASLRKHVQVPSSAPPAVRKSAPPSPRAVRVRLEATGRSGKVVTRIGGLPVANLTAIAARIGRALGCSATLEGNDVLLAGSLRERASEWLERAGDLREISEPEKPKSTEPKTPFADTALTPSNAGAGTNRRDIRPGQRVAIVLKADQGSGRLTHGIVRDILTNSATHPRGIKVRLDSGEVGRVQAIFR